MKQVFQKISYVIHMSTCHEKFLEISYLNSFVAIYAHQDPLKHLLGLVFNCVVMNMIKLQHLTLNTFYIEIVWEVKVQAQR